MNRLRITACTLASFAGSAAVLAQDAPTSAQQYEVRFVVDASGPLAAGPAATAIGITMEARITILDNTVNTRNFGLSRVGGSNGVFRATFNDALSAAANLNQGSVQRGLTGQAFNDTNGNPIEGHFSPFRGSFNPQQGPLFMGSNTDANNGSPNNPTLGAPFMTQLVGSRGLNFGSDGTQAYGVDAFAPVYRMVYLPRPDADRIITVNVTGLSARYLWAVNGPFPTGSVALNLPNQSFSFRVPAPSAAGPLLLALVGLTRRRRTSSRAQA